MKFSSSLMAGIILVTQGIMPAGAASTDGGYAAAGRRPLFDIRALQLTLRKSTGDSDPVKQTKKDVLEIIRRSARLGFNVVLLKVSLSIQLRHTKGFASRWAYSIDEIKEIIGAARGLGMQVIPEINLLTHQDLMIGQIDPGLMLNSSDYNPNDQHVYDMVFPILDEIIEIFKPDYINIGHDEAFGIRKKTVSQPPVRTLTPDEFLADTLKIHAYLKKKNIRTMMWADMLLDPAIYGSYYHPAEINGYDGFAALADKLPRDIILCDWHYISTSAGGDYPSYTDLQNKGFTVWGAVWKDPRTIANYSAYVARHARKNEGMIATTWWSFVAQEKDVIDQVLDRASNAFFK